MANFTFFDTFKLIIILWTSICLQDAQAIRKPFEVVKRCPFNESEWKVRAAHTACNGSESYHCLLTEGGVSLREQCTETSLFTSGFCPIFTSDGYLQWSPCKDTACPTSSYRSDEVYQYQICYHRKTDYPKEEYKEQGSKDEGSVIGETTITVIGLVSLFFIVIVVLVVFYKRNQFGCKERVQYCFTDAERGHIPCQTEPLLQQEEHETKLKELLKYLVHILKQELGVNDLKEKVVIHSKSVNEHFSEQLIKDLQSLKDINDYSQLDASLVLTLLRNFCEGIEPPSTGWDCEPPDDETNVGADIERIRYMWNKYCDNDLQFKCIDDVYIRMKQRYETLQYHEVGVTSDDFEFIKEKIPGIKLSPDCTVEKGIVITENITTAVNILKSKSVVILKGVIGCGKTHALKAIQNHFQGTNWETEWVESEILKEEISTKRPTILLYDNLFGQFGSCVFSQTDVENTEKTLSAIEGACDNIKVVIGIHTHVYDEVNKSLKLNFINKKNITVDMDKLSEAESLLIFKEQLKQGHCSKMDSNCWFKTVGFQSVLDKLSKNQGHIGGPFLSLMYCNQHDLFSDESFSVNPVQTLIQYFHRMRHDSPTLYHCLVYLMCVQEHNFKGELKDVAGMISIDITNNTLENIISQSGFTCIQGEDKKKRETLAHDMLTIVLFKSAAETIETFTPVAQKCKVDIIIQLLRPANGTYGNLYCEFKGAANKYYKFRDCGKFCVFRLVRKYAQEGQVNHPFKSEEIFKEKYKRYVENEPTLYGKREEK